MYGFDKQRIISSVVKVLNADFNFTARLGRYFKAEDIEDVEVWWIGIRVKFKKGAVCGQRFTMISKAKVCAKSAPYAREEVTFDRDGIAGDRLHIITYTLKNDPSGEQHLWTASMGFDEVGSAQIMKEWLWQTNQAAHSVIRPGKRTGCKWELKVWELHPDVLEDRLSPNGGHKVEVAPVPESVVTENVGEIMPETKLSRIDVIKPNGAYRLMDGGVQLTAVFTKPELNYEIAKLLNLGHEVVCHDPSGRKAYNCKLVGDEVKYTLVRKVRAVA